jgi:MFS transporter, PHS family, inorganic phosphate transporter
LIFSFHSLSPKKGISAACGKLGAALGSAFMSPILESRGLPTVLIICAIVAFLGAIHTFFFTVETLGKSLEQINTTNKPVAQT